MYLPPYHQLTDRDALFSLIDTHPLGTWVCQGSGGLTVNHTPFVLDRRRGPHGTLLGHVARANSVWREWAADTPCVVAFHGPQAYITPGWYPGKAEHGRVVPTWNHTVAHAHGVARVVDDRDALLDLLNRLTDAQETGRPAPWRVADAPADFVDRLMRAIVGIQIPIDRLEGKLKASQDEARADRLGTVSGLRACPDHTAQAMADLVQKALDTDAPT
ncbi:MAG: FMN-binding negative transcriptional regulator [Hydrogenophaga sp.]|uniref:FMN-binding negative transcriptional regulator n=1 Tax=Hydrogenophaga sp. TaxID=1904254 RepID=UPI0025C4BEDF|nr:FMN-binding negative transcriptional regulator [Hydrogenophaga sp.]MBT9549731.1 FMN-binding negative transcriptional regulator [Hydrogenophaga sp.]